MDTGLYLESTVFLRIIFDSLVFLIIFAYSPTLRIHGYIILRSVIYKVRKGDKFCWLWKYYFELLHCITSGEIEILIRVVEPMFVLPQSRYFI